MYLVILVYETIENSYLNKLIVMKSYRIINIISWEAKNSLKATFKAPYARTTFHPQHYLGRW